MPDNQNSSELARWAVIARDGTPSDWQAEQSDLRRYFAGLTTPAMLNGVEAGPLDRSAPPRVWLQVDTDGDNKDHSEAMPPEAWGELTWHHSPIGGQEVEYVRKDLIRAAGNRSEPEYDRELIADMLKDAADGNIRRWPKAAICLQERRLREASNRSVEDAGTARLADTQRQIIEAAERRGDERAMRKVAAIAHSGGLIGMNPHDALTTIRRLSLPYWGKEEKPEQVHATLVQQPAACGTCGEAIRPDAMTGTTCRCAQQPAAVDGAMVRKVAKVINAEMEGTDDVGGAWKRLGSSERRLRDRMARAALTAALSPPGRAEGEGS